MKIWHLDEKLQSEGLILQKRKSLILEIPYSKIH